VGFGTRRKIKRRQIRKIKKKKKTDEKKKRRREGEEKEQKNQMFQLWRDENYANTKQESIDHKTGRFGMISWDKKNH